VRLEITSLTYWIALCGIVEFSNLGIEQFSPTYLDARHGFLVLN